MGEVRTRYLAALMIIMVLLGTNGCLDDGISDLEFVEQDPGVRTADREQQQSPLTSSSSVDLAEPSVQQIRLCVLPFRNLTDLENLDYLQTVFNQSVEFNLEDYVRVIESVVYDENRYSEMMTQMGRNDMQPPDEEIAEMIRAETDAEIILFGDIRVVDNQVQIEPFLVSFEEGFLVRPMDARPVSVSNFLATLDSYVQELLDEIIQQRQG